jgi:hypothetical protein
VEDGRGCGGFTCARWNPSPSFFFRHKATEEKNGRQGSMPCPIFGIGKKNGKMGHPSIQLQLTVFQLFFESPH